MSIHITDSVQPEQWDEFAENAGDANIFHTRRFMDIFGDSPEHVPCSFFLMEEGSIRAALIALHSTFTNKMFAPLGSRCVVYGGILHSEKLNHRYLNRHLGEMLRAYDEHVKKRSLFTEIRNLTDATHLIPAITARGYKFLPHLNYIIDLEAGEERIWSNLSQGLRKAIRKAEKGGIEVAEIESGSQLKTFHDIVSRTYAKVHIPCFDLPVFEKAWDLLSSRGMLRITLARAAERPIAARAALTYRGRVFDWFAGSDEEGDARNANALLAWEMIRWGCRKGMRIFDFGGAGDPNRSYGVRDFKMRFMGRLVNYGRFMRIYSYPRYAASYLGYALLRRVLY